MTYSFCMPYNCVTGVSSCQWPYFRLILSFQGHISPLRSQEMANVVMLIRYLLSETVHVGDTAVSWECCHILFLCLRSVERVWVHVSGLASTSTRHSKATHDPPDLKKQQLLSCWSGTCWWKWSVLLSSQHQANISISFSYTLQVVCNRCGFMPVALLLSQLIVPRSLLTPRVSNAVMLVSGPCWLKLSMLDTRQCHASVAISLLCALIVCNGCGLMSVALPPA